MRTLVLASRKGGAGKTTLAAHIAVEAERCGDGPVAIIDTDPMAGLANWWNARASEAPQFFEIAGDGLSNTLDVLRSEGYALVVIDTPPSASPSMAAVIAASDLVIVPVVPSPNDLRAINETLMLIEEQDRPLVFAMTNASTNGRLTTEAAVALSQFGTVAPVTIHTRQDYRSSMADGRTAGEVNSKSKSAAEMTRLWTYVKSRLEKKEPRHGKAAARA